MNAPIAHQPVINRQLTFRFGAIFRKSGLKLALGLGLVLAVLQPAAGQVKSFASLVSDFQEYNRKALQEKIFLHLDRPSYVCGETIWFKVYTVEGAHHHPLDMSKVAYVEVLDKDQKPVLQGKVALKEGTGSGSFVLPVTLEAGNYSVRAYTNWMKNFSQDFYFQQSITIINTFQPLGLKTLTDTAAYAIRFFPEGGHLVRGLPVKVAFQAQNSVTGKGAFCQGEILDQTGKVVASFQPTKLGIGYFRFTPTGTDHYTAQIRFANGKVIQQKLPPVQEQGFGVQLEDSNSGELRLTVRATGEHTGTLYLLGHTRQRVAVTASAPLTNGQALFSVLKDSLPEGITHFTVFNSQQKPVCERLFFKRPAQELEIETSIGKNQVGTREKVALDLRTQFGAGASTSANLSVAVFRNDQLATSNPADIKAYLWLGSDLRGTIEQVSSYFSETGPKADEAFDNLMLTHGWSRFSWEQILSQQTPAFAYLPEYDGHLIRGKVTQATTGEPAKGIRAFLASPGKLIRFYSSVSKGNGAVLFDAKDFFGQKEVVLQTNTLKDSIYHLQLLDPFSEKHAKTALPLFEVSENLKDAIYLRHLEVQAQNIYFEKSLNRFQAPKIDSLAFYGKPSQQYLLDDYTRFKVMEEVMREYVPGVMVRKRRDGFHFLVLDDANRQIFQEDPLVLLDGVPVFDIDQIMAFDPLKVRKLDVVTSKYYNGSLVSNGVVSYTTYKGDLAGFPLDSRALLQEYEGLQLQREFYAPAYDTNEQKLSRLPDWRNLLFWAPELVTDESGRASLHFYTSDQPGSYSIVVQGLTKNGLPGSKVLTFEVKKPL
ncbi:hypothetical protein ACFSC6_00320 [Rufibacter sediminis]|uniref:Macroglobulin domain-containing protein n=1 Tax=Rufibacter sediminis TaxID=2762756 RepID=A0ABR6VLW0_9BACT|nr:hypothetical protein [Rufibacter sediminis]MBC3538204.1 hypothetical protein [Rufibacter sediminis]